MSEFEEYTSAQLVSRESVNAWGKDFVKYIADSIIRELSEKVLDRAKFSDVIVSLKPLRITELPSWNQVEYRRNITVTDLVRCEECKWHDGEGLCERHGMVVGMDLSFFCRDGERDYYVGVGGDDDEQVSRAENP